MSTKVNKNFKNRLNAQERREAYDEIKKACTRQFMLMDSKKSDMKKVKEIFYKYFNKDNPLLDINAPIESGASSFTPLMTTTWLGYNEETEELLKLGADPSIAPDNNTYPLHIAASNSRTLILHTLLKKNSDIINIKNVMGQTPLICAVEAGNLEIVKELVTRYHADLQIADNGNKTAIDYAHTNKRLSIETYLRYFILENTLDDKKEEKKINKI